MSVKLIFLHITLTLFVLFNCGTDNEGSQGIERLSFAVNDSLLGPVFIDSTLGFSFHPPLGWEQVPDTTLHKAKEKLTDGIDPHSGLQVMPLQFFIDFQSGSSCCLSRLTGVHIENKSPDSLGEYRSLLKAKFPEMNIEEGVFRVDDVSVYQFLITNNEKVIFKLLCANLSKHTFQVDYIVPRLVYIKQIKAIESSIGSFKMLL